MTPDQRFARWVQIAIAALVCAFIYFLFADLAAPLTPQAQLNRPVVRIAPRVSGQVVEVATLLGCLVVLSAMLVLYNHHDLLPLVTLLLWVLYCSVPAGTCTSGVCRASVSPPSRPRRSSSASR